MDDIPPIRDAEEIRKRIINCRNLETLKRFEYSLKKTKIVFAKIGKEEVEKN